MAVEIYSGRSLKLFWSEGDEAPFCFVSFAAWSGSGDGVPFGLSFFEKHKIPAFYVVQSGGNVWWHTSEIIDVCEIVRRRIQCEFDGAVMYGSSMGGYAAIHLQDFFRAKFSFSIAPQVAVSNKYAEFETRWSQDRSSISNFLFDEKSNLQFQLDKTVILSDPGHYQDSKHIDFLRRYGKNNHLIDVPYSNHETARTLVMSGVMKKCLLNLSMNGEVDVASLKNEAAISFEGESKTFFNFFRKNVSTLEDATLSRYLKLFENYIGKGVVTDFESAYMVAEIYSYLGDADEAIEYSERSLSLYPNSDSVPNYLLLKHQSIKDRLGIV